MADAVHLHQCITRTIYSKKKIQIFGKGVGKQNS